MNCEDDDRQRRTQFFVLCERVCGYNGTNPPLSSVKNDPLPLFHHHKITPLQVFHNVNCSLCVGIIVT